MAMPQIIEKLPLIFVTTRPEKLAISSFLIILVLTFVSVLTLLPYTYPMPEPIFKKPFIFGLCFAPDILADPLRPSINIAAYIHISIHKHLPSTAMLHTTSDLPLIPRLLRHYHAEPFRPVLPPLAHISLSLRSPPPRTLLNPTHKLAFIGVAVGPVESTIALRLVVYVVADVDSVGQ